MNRIHSKSTAVVLGFVLSLLLSGPALAEDIEVYVGGNLGQQVAKPNILFLIDTSGSMDSQLITQADYDPARDYSTGSNACFDKDRIYFLRSGGQVVTNCSSRNWLEPTYNLCETSHNALAASGFFTDRFTGWRNNHWNGTLMRQNYVECRSDTGSHGQTSGDPKIYANGAYNIAFSNAWTSDPNQEMNWADNTYSRTHTLFTGNFLNYVRTESPSVVKTRLQVVKSVVGDLVDSIAGVKVGLMRLRDREGGSIEYAINDVETARTDFKNILNSWTAHGFTPLSEQLYEALRYYRGEGVVYGGAGTLDARDPSNANRYQSPIEHQCQQNFVITLSDGRPTSDWGVNNTVPLLPGFQSATGKTQCANDHGSNNAKCLDELAMYMANVDQDPGIAGNQYINTYTIGFNLDLSLLKDTAAAGNGKYFVADDTVGLAQAFTQILTEIIAVNSTFTVPAVSVNAFNRSTHSNDIYFSLFKPDEGPSWNGNVKKFRLEKINGSSELEIVDSTNSRAIDPVTGFFEQGATSFWTPAAQAPDGGDVILGGVVSQLPTQRKIYTYTGTSTPANVQLSAAPNALHENNSRLTKDLLGISGQTDTYREQLLRWARGLEPTGALPLKAIGDPLHSSPLLIQYSASSNHSNADSTLFFGTNQGYLHAVSATTGVEQFAFVPQELLKNLPILYTNQGGDPRPYGLDGELSAWVNDVDRDGNIEANEGDHVYLYIGMRRGGNDYYALDVTDRNAPKLKWMIAGGEGRFTELGQTWSKPLLRKIKYDNTIKHVLIFGGGYDLNQDTNAVAEADTIGRAVYIVDAETGTRLWFAGASGSGADLVLPDMTNSIPAAVSAIDVDSDGLVDRLYIGDTAAQIWRFDIDNHGNTGASNLVSGGRFAALNGSGAINNRRFYYSPDVALIIEPGKASYLALLVGSGYRAHPLNNLIHDRIYMLRDENVYNTPNALSVITENDLYDTTHNLIGEGDPNQKIAAQGALDSAQGWYIRLMEADGSFAGEKVLSKPLIVSGVGLLTSFRPTVNTGPDSCQPSQGNGATYYLNLGNGTPFYNFDGIGSDNNLTRNDRKMNLLRGGIPPAPTLIITEDGNAALVGPERVPDPSNQKVHKTYWYERGYQKINTSGGTP